HEKCLIHNCYENTVAESTVSQFFGKFSNNTKSLKLKDWPPQAEFEKAFPQLFADFENAVPFPVYTRRCGPFNLASYFPSGWSVQDLPEAWRCRIHPGWMCASGSQPEELREGCC